MYLWILYLCRINTQIFILANKTRLKTTKHKPAEIINQQKRANINLHEHAEILILQLHYSHNTCRFLGSIALNISASTSIPLRALCISDKLKNTIKISNLQIMFSKTWSSIKCFIVMYIVHNMI